MDSDHTVDEGSSRGRTFQDRHPEGFIVSPRPGAAGLMLAAESPLSLVLLYVIAIKAYRTNVQNKLGLVAGEAMVRGCAEVGMTDKQYRVAGEHLKKLGFVKSRRANKGTIFRLINTDVFDINEAGKGEQKGERGASKGRAKGEQRASRKLHQTQPKAHEQRAESRSGESGQEGKKERREERQESDVPRSNSGGSGVVQEGGAFVEPRFDPIPDGMFQRELEPMLKAAKRAKAKVVADEEARFWTERERPGYADDLAWYEAELQKGDLTLERRKKLGRELENLKASRMERVPGELKPEALAVVQAWLNRIDEIERALNGVRR